MADAVAPSDQQSIRGLLDDYLKKYATRDDRLTALFSEDFSGFTGCLATHYPEVPRG